MGKSLYFEDMSPENQKIMVSLGYKMMKALNLTLHDDDSFIKAILTTNNISTDCLNDPTLKPKYAPTILAHLENNKSCCVTRFHGFEKESDNGYVMALWDRDKFVAVMKMCDIEQIAGMMVVIVMITGGDGKAVKNGRLTFDPLTQN